MVKISIYLNRRVFVMFFCIFIPSHTIVAGYYGIPSGVGPSSARRTLFPDNLRRMALEHGGQLDYEVMQRIVFQGYSTPNFDSVIAL